MRTSLAFNEFTLLKAKQQIEEPSVRFLNNEEKLKLGFIGGGFFVTLFVIEPEYKAIKLFIKATNRKHVLNRLQEFPDAYYFIIENPNCEISVTGAGLQHPSKAQGLVHEQKKN